MGRMLKQGAGAMKFQVLLVGGVAAVVLSACGNDARTNQPIQTHVTLEKFNSCNELEQFIEDQAVRDMRSSLELLKESPYWWYGGPVAMEDGVGTPRAGGPNA